jgi:hypothetical protein
MEKKQNDKISLLALSGEQKDFCKAKRPMSFLFS